MFKVNTCNLHLFSLSLSGHHSCSLVNAENEMHNDHGQLWTVGAFVSVPLPPRHVALHRSMIAQPPRGLMGFVSEMQCDESMFSEYIGSLRRHCQCDQTEKRDLVESACEVVKQNRI